MTDLTTINNNNNLIDFKLTNQNDTTKSKEISTRASQFKPKLLPQFLAGIAGNLAAFAWGTVISWSATGMPLIELHHKVTPDQVSWISSVAALGACCACLTASLLLDNAGRRKTMLCVAPIFMGGWSLIYFSNNISMLIGGRYVTGFAGGLFSIATPTYIAETSGSKIRGMLINGYDLMINVGMLFIVIVGTYTSWRNSALVCFFVPVIFILVMLFMPESPRFLMSKGRDQEASKSLLWLRGATEHGQIESEFLELKKSIVDSNQDTLKDRFRELSKVKKAFFLSYFLFVFQVSSGIAAVLFNQVQIFKDAGTSLNEYYSTIIVLAVQIVGSVGAASVVDRIGRRILLLSSEALLVLSLAALGTFFHVKKTEAEFASSYLDWLPLTSLILYLIGFAIGIGPIPYSVMPELLPQRVRGLAASMVMTTKWGLSFLLTRFFNDLLNTLGNDGVYWLFGSCCLCGSVYIYFLIPETKQLSLEEIQRRFLGKKTKNSTI